MIRAMSGSLFSRACLVQQVITGTLMPAFHAILARARMYSRLSGVGHGLAVVVLIFHLHHDDRAAHRYLVLLDDGENFREPVLRGLEALRVSGAKGEALGRHPGGKSPALPFRANIGARTGDHHETHFVNEL